MNSNLLYKDKNWFINKYINEKLSLKEIAFLFGVSITVPLYWLKKFDVPSRIGGNTGKKLGPFTDDHKKNISKVKIGKKRSKESIQKQIKSHKGYKHSEETRRKISEGQLGKKRSKEFGDQMSKRQIGENNPNWRGGETFAPYCHLFNNIKKEEIRNRDDRKCELCGKSEILNGERLIVHHIDNNKMQGCNDNKWQLVSLCRLCHSKKDTIEREFILISNLHWRINSG